jgi:flagellar basal body P-ring formation protein FlgA
MILSLLVAGCLRLEAGQITAADLGAVVPAFSALPGATPLAYAPAPGARRILDAAELARIARRHGLVLERGQEICVESAAEPLDAAELLAALSAALGMPEAKIEIVEYSRYGAPRGAIEFPRAGLAAPPVAQPTAAVLWRGFVRYGGGRRFPIWARVRILVSRECVIAAETLPAGRPIEERQVRLGTYRGFPWSQAPAASLERAVGRAPRRAIPAGAPVPADALEAPYDVGRGQIVAVEVASGDARVKLDGRAGADGRAGQTIPVVNPSSGRRFRAQVEGPGKVLVKP